MMSINYLTVTLSTLAYVTVIFGLAWITKKKLIPSKILNSPFTYVLSLGVCIQTWSFYTTVPIASQEGYGYLGYTIGFSLAFLFAPIFLRPILYITKTHQLSSLADLFAFRFRSPLAGSLTTLVLTFSIFPFIAGQINAASGVAKLLLPNANTHYLAFIFSAVILAFTLFFGATENAGRDRHQSIIMVLAFETIFKLFVLVVIAFFCIYIVFGGFSNLDAWLAEIPPSENVLNTPVLNTSNIMLVLMFFSASMTLPHIFHVTFRENSNPLNLKFASWGVPLILLISAFPALPILWASMKLETVTSMEYAAIGVGLISQSSALTLLIFVGGLSAAMGLSIISALTTANMGLNHLILPHYKPATNIDLYKWLITAKRWIISIVMVVCYGMYLYVSSSSFGSELGYLTFVSCLQCLPGIISVLYWPQANKKGFITGLSVGVITMLLTGVIPALAGITIFNYEFSNADSVNWIQVAIYSLLFNFISMSMVSRLTKSSAEERYAGELCTLDTIHQPRKLELAAKSTMDFIERLNIPLGKTTAEREVHRALMDLGYSFDEKRPYHLQQLRDTLEANLSGLIGPTVANQMIDVYLPYQLVSESGHIDINFIESQLEAYPGNLSGIAEDLDKLRRHHRQTLEDLPLGICALDKKRRISLWNKTMEKLTGIHVEDALNMTPEELPEPWSELLTGFINNSLSNSANRQSVQVDNKTRWISLHKAQMEETQNEGLVVVLEDMTETQLLEKELIHSERLASIGSLAAGVAHEIGNPMTAIACLAQNVRDESQEDDLRQTANKIIEQTKRTSRIVQSLVSFAHKGESNDSRQHIETEKVNIHEAVEAAIELISLGTEADQLSFKNEVSTNCFILADKQLLQQVFVNFLSNARDASPVGGIITVSESSTDQETMLIIEDQGPGISEAHQARVFEPFFTTKEPGKGTGLGLSLAYSILEEMQGKIRIESPVDTTSNTGTRVIVTFPCYHGNVLSESYS